MPINAKKCGQILTKLIFLIGQGEGLNTNEATDTFFAATKLFQCPDVRGGVGCRFFFLVFFWILTHARTPTPTSQTTLRSLLYLTIKEMAPFTENVIIVTSSLTKDMTGKLDAYRGSAIRALCRITDPSMLQGIERYLKQAIVDKNPAVSSAAIVSSLVRRRRAVFCPFPVSLTAAPDSSST